MEQSVVDSLVTKRLPGSMSEHGRRTIELIDEFTEAVASDTFHEFFARLASRLMDAEIK